MSEQEQRLEKFSYDDAIVRKFVVATLVWGVVGMLVGLWLALELVVHQLNLTPWLTFGRLRPLHTNAVIFAFAGNAVFAAIYYSSQRLLKARMFSDRLSAIHFWGWQLIIVAAAITLPLGFTQGKEYAELEWPIDLAIAGIWVTFAVNFFATIAKRREKHLYVAIWFYIASVVVVAILHIFNNLALPVSFLESYPIYSGVQDAFMQWWYGHNAVAFLLTTPFLGMMYYFLPKAAERPVFSYRLSILHFWSLVFLYIWAGPHHLHYTAMPAWASTLGMLFSVMLWMPSWGGMINGLLTLRGAWGKVSEEPVLKFFVVAITFYGMSTFEGPMMSIKSVNGLSHYTDWTIGHVHAGALGWVGFMTLGMIYWLVPRLFQADLYSKKLATWHFWLATFGIVLYVVSMWVAGITQGLMLRAVSENGELVHKSFIETLNTLIPMYWVRALGGTMYLTGMLMGCWNIFKTWQARPAEYEDKVYEAPALKASKHVDEPEATEKEGPKKGGLLFWITGGRWHRKWEGMPLTFTVLVIVAVVVASLLELVPAFLVKSNVPKIESVQPYSPLELAGREIYIREGCYNCHSQMVRPFVDETLRYGEYSKPGEFVYDRPFQWGSRRIGPDLHRVGGLYSHLWHVRHMRDPRSTSKGSIMPHYRWLLTDGTDYGSIQKRVSVNHTLGVPYTKEALNNAEAMARAQAQVISKELVTQGGPANLADKEIIALVAYLQRLGTDISIKTPTEKTTPKKAANEAADGSTKTAEKGAAQ